MTSIATGGQVALHLRGVMLPQGITRDVFVVQGCFTFRPPDDASTVLDGGYLLPGLVDAHAHLGLASPAPPDAPPEERARASARAQLAAGVLAIREPGGPNRASAGIGPHEGLPRVVTGGRFLAPPGTYFPGLAREVADEDLPAAAEDEARASGAWAKVIGDWVGRDGRMQPNYRTATLAEAARRVHAAGARIAIHAITPEAIEAAIEAGFDSIEHGQGLRDDHIAAMAARGIALVPTLTILPALPAVVAELGLAPAGRAAMLSAVARHPEMARRAAAAGVLVLAGTDAGMGPHGMVREEIRYLLDAGMPPETALAAGSWAARRFLGLPGIEEGGPADLVAYPDDPRGDPAVLTRPSLRMLDGRMLPLP
jgi:imidazolonepropionase-like amidohydrolase